MKVYISADMEGVAGVVLPVQLSRGTPEYEEARKLLLGEVHAAIQGAWEAGAETVIARDAHGSGLNLPLAELDPRARYVLGTSPTGRFPGLDHSFDAAVLIGYHAMAGTVGAVRDHTMSSADGLEVAVNGRPTGEIGLDAAVFGYFGVPVVLVSGDDKACREAESFLPGAATVETKVGWGRHTALTLAPQAARTRIRDEVRSALTRLAQGGQFPVYRVDSPLTVEIRFSSTDRLDTRPLDGVRSVRVDGRTALYRGDDLLEVLDRVFR